MFLIKVAQYYPTIGIWLEQWSHVVGVYVGWQGLIDGMDVGRVKPVLWVKAGTIYM